MKRGLSVLIFGIVGTISVLAVVRVVDCHRLTREVGPIDETPEICRDADTATLAVMLSMLSTVLGLAVKSDDDDRPPGADEE